MIRLSGSASGLYGQETVRFVEVGESAGVDDPGFGRGVAWGDYDGDLDLYVSNREGPSRLFRNEGNDNNWIGFELEGRVSNRSAIGACVRIVCDTLGQLRQVSGGSGYASQDMLPVHFGLGSRSSVDSMFVRWPSGTVQTWTDTLQAGRYYTIIEGQTTGLDQDRATVSVVPREFRLYQNYPNPFNAETTIEFDLPEAAAVELCIYNGAGQLVRRLKGGVLEAGNHHVSWDGRDDRGGDVGSGIYFCRLEAGGFSQTRRMVLVR